MAARRQGLTGATSRSHRVSIGDLGHRLTARVTFSAAGYTTRTVTTAQTGWAKATSTVRAPPRPARTVTFTIRVAAAGVPAPDGTVQVRFAGDHYRTVKVVDGRASLS